MNVWPVKVLTKLVFIWLIVSAGFAVGAIQKAVPIKLAAADWCPYTCQYTQLPGYVVEYIKILLNQEGYALSVTILPWETAIKLTREGLFDGLITAVPEEAADFTFTDVATDSYRSCFYARPLERWRYKSKKDLTAIRLGIIKDYAYGDPVDSWVKSNSNVYVSRDKSALSDLIVQLKNEKIDALIEDANVLSHFLYINKVNDKVLEVGCLEDAFFYLGFSPQYNNAPTLVKRLNKALSNKNNKNLLLSIKARYGI